MSPHVIWRVYRVVADPRPHRHCRWMPPGSLPLGFRAAYLTRRSTRHNQVLSDRIAIVSPVTDRCTTNAGEGSPFMRERSALRVPWAHRTLGGANFPLGSWRLPLCGKLSGQDRDCEEQRAPN